MTRANSYIGTSSQRAAFLNSAPEGTLWSDTNGTKGVWVKRDASWVQLSTVPPDPPALGTFSFASGWAANSSVSLTRSGGRVFMDGLVRPTGNITGSSYVTVGTLPINARPGVKCVFAVTGWVAGTSSEYLPRASLYVGADGGVYIYPSAILTAALIDGVSWPATT